MNNDALIQFLIERGWEININRPDEKIARHDDLSPDWIDLDSAFELEKNYDPNAAYEFEMMQNLSGRHLKMFRDFMDE